MATLSVNNSAGRAQSPYLRGCKSHGFVVGIAIVFLICCSATMLWIGRQASGLKWPHLRSHRVRPAQLVVGTAGAVSGTARDADHFSGLG